MPDTPGSWLWWVFSVIIAGIAINLISRKLETPVDSFYARIHMRIYGNISRRAMESQLKVERLVDLMLADPAVASAIYVKRATIRNDEGTLLVLIFAGIILFFLAPLHIRSGSSFGTAAALIGTSIVFTGFLFSFVHTGKQPILVRAIDKYEEIKGIEKDRVLAPEWNHCQEK